MCCRVPPGRYNTGRDFAPLKRGIKPYKLHRKPKGVRGLRRWEPKGLIFIFTFYFNKIKPFFGLPNFWSGVLK